MFVYLRLCYIRQFTKCLFGKATVFNKISVISQILQNAMHTGPVILKKKIYGANEGTL